MFIIQQNVENFVQPFFCCKVDRSLARVLNRTVNVGSVFRILDQGPNFFSRLCVHCCVDGAQIQFCVVEICVRTGLNQFSAKICVFNIIDRVDEKSFPVGFNRLVNPVII